MGANVYNPDGIKHVGSDVIGMHAWSVIMIIKQPVSVPDYTQNLGSRTGRLPLPSDQWTPDLNAKSHFFICMLQ